VLSFSTFEHIKYPHVATHELMKVLRIGGLLFIQTHQTFTLHAYPHDYYRFSTEALASLFPERMGFRVQATGYVFPAEIHSQEDGVQRNAYLDTHLWGEKVAVTPEHYFYDFETSAGTRIATLSREA
jgi:hypothetical protein